MREIVDGGNAMYHALHLEVSWLWCWFHIYTYFPNSLNCESFNDCSLLYIKERKQESTKLCPTLVTLQTVACQAPLSLGFSK